jgi:hypothetical protein
LQRARRILTPICYDREWRIYDVESGAGSRHAGGKGGSLGRGRWIALTASAIVTSGVNELQRDFYLLLFDDQVGKHGEQQWARGPST